MTFLKHIQQIHEGKKRPKPFSCELCGKMFYDKNGLNKHFESAHTTKIKSFICDNCGKSFLQENTLIQHTILVHKSEIPLPEDIQKFQCNLCDKFFLGQYGKKGLKKHVNSVHEKKKPYQCSICGNSYSERSKLNRHVVAHEAKKSIKCYICQEPFEGNSNLTQHITSVHKEVKVSHCTECDKSFFGTYREKGLKRHISSVHEKNKPFQCTLCESNFSENGKLLRHVRNVHESKKCTDDKSGSCNEKEESVISQFGDHFLAPIEQK